MALKRSIIFDLIGLLVLMLTTWVFYMRITLGKCEGYKTIIRKPFKEIRYRRIYGIIFGVSILLIANVGLWYHIYNYYLDNSNVF